MRRICAALLVLWAAISGVSAVDNATDLKVGDVAGCGSNVAGNRHVKSNLPYFSWTYTAPGGSAQSNWQVQVDDDPTFLPNGACPVAYWDSGIASKGADAAGTCFQMRGSGAGGAYQSCNTVYPQVDRGMDVVYWRVRVYDPNNPAAETVGADAGWLDWVDSESTGERVAILRNHIPSQPRNLFVSVNTASSADTVISTGSAAGSPTDYYVSTTGTDPASPTQANCAAADGTIGSPFRTIKCGAYKLAAGDTLNVLPGIYRERLVFDSTYTDGTYQAPVTIRSTVSGAAVIQDPGGGNTLGNAVVKFTALDNVLFEGFQIQSSFVTGVRVIGGNWVHLADISFHPDYASLRVINQANYTDMYLIDVDGSPTNVIVSGCDFTVPMFQDAHIGNGSNIEYRSNEFANFSRYAIVNSSSNPKTVVVQDNDIHDGTAEAAEGSIFNYQNSHNALYYRNRFYRINGAATGSNRSGGAIWKNNTFSQTGIAINIRQRSGFFSFVNNIVTLQSNGITVAGQGAFSGADISYNTIHATTPMSQTTYPARQIGNCLGLTCDPMIYATNTGLPAATQMRFSALSGPAFNAADPATPVPVSDGVSWADPECLTFMIDQDTPHECESIANRPHEKADMGAYEAAAGDPPYHTIETAVVYDLTPQFTWTIHDFDNDMPTGAQVTFDDNTNVGVTYTDAVSPDTQGCYQVQIDTSPLFNYYGVVGAGVGRPLLDTGTITSTTQSFTLPDANPLVAGTNYYFRVRQCDDVETSTLGAWSDTFSFRVERGANPVPPSTGGGHDRGHPIDLIDQ